MNFTLHAPTLMTIVALLGAVLAITCFTFKNNPTLGNAAARLGVGNLTLGASCLSWLFALHEPAPLSLGASSFLLCAGLMIHLSALREMLKLRTVDRWLWLLAGTLAAALATGSKLPGYEVYFSLATDVCSFITAGIFIYTSKELKGRFLKAVKTTLQIAFFGVAFVALLKLSVFVGHFNWVSTQNHTLITSLGLAIYIVGTNLAYLTLYMTLQHQRMVRMVNLDSLTEVLNRRGLETHLLRLLERNSGKLTGTVLLIDIDRFKSINDNLGHATGDFVLRTIGKVLQANLRGVDVVGRTGGAQFSLVLPNVTSSNAQSIAERLRVQLSDLKMDAPEFDNVSITVSIGVAEFDISKPVLDQLLQRSDLALHTAKTNGRNRTEVWSPKLELLARTLRFQRSESALPQTMARAH